MLRCANKVQGEAGTTCVDGVPKHSLQDCMLALCAGVDDLHVQSLPYISGLEEASSSGNVSAAAKPSHCTVGCTLFTAASELC